VEIHASYEVILNLAGAALLALGVVFALRWQKTRA